MQDLADFFSTAQGVFASAIGGFLVTLALSYPTACYRLAEGEWQRCGTFDNCKEDLLGRFQGSVRCENVFGLDAFANTEPTATVVSFIIAIVCGGAAAVFGNLAKSSS